MSNTKRLSADEAWQVLEDKGLAATKQDLIDVRDSTDDEEVRCVTRRLLLLRYSCSSTDECGEG